MTLNDKRKERKKSLKQCAEVMGVSESSASLMLNAKRNIKWERAQKLAKLFKISTTKIFLLYEFTKTKEEDENDT